MQRLSSGELLPLHDDGLQLVRFDVHLQERDVDVLLQLLLQGGFFFETLRFDVDDERSALPELAFNSNRPSHLFDDLLAYRKPKAGPLSVSVLVFFQLAEVEEEVFDAFFRNAHPCVLNAYFEIDVHLILLVRLLALLNR